MNKNRRKSLLTLRDDINDTASTFREYAEQLRAHATDHPDDEEGIESLLSEAPGMGGVDDLHTALESIRDEEQEYLDNMPESLQGGEKGDMAQSAIDAMDAALDSLTEASDTGADSEDAEELATAYETAADTLEAASASVEEAAA